MSRGKVWTEEASEELRRRYSDEKNEVLAREMGYAIRTIERRAAQMGLHKSAGFMESTRLAASRAGVEWFEYMRASGQKIRKRSYGGKHWEKGHRWDEATEQKRVEALRERSWQERRRLMHGLMPLTGWKMKVYKRFVDDLEK